MGWGNLVRKAMAKDSAAAQTLKTLSSKARKFGFGNTSDNDVGFLKGVDVCFGLLLAGGGMFGINCVFPSAWLSLICLISLVSSSTVLIPSTSAPNTSQPLMNHLWSILLKPNILSSRLTRLKVARSNESIWCFIDNNTYGSLRSVSPCASLPTRFCSTTDIVEDTKDRALSICR